MAILWTTPSNSLQPGWGRPAPEERLTLVLSHPHQGGSAHYAAGMPAPRVVDPILPGGLAAADHRYYQIMFWWYLVMWRNLRG